MSEDKKSEQAEPAKPAAASGVPEQSQSTANEEVTAQAETREAGQRPNNEEKRDPLDALRQENADLKDRLLRTMAEMENLRRRTEREKSETAKYAISNFARDVLTVGDNIRRAIDAVPEGAMTSDPALKSLADGVEMTERELLNVMERHGIQRINPKGEQFDPNHHQAMFEVPNPDVAAGTVVEVVQSGFMIGDRVLRPALVGVSKGGEKAAKPQAEQGPAQPQAQKKEAPTQAQRSNENKSDQAEPQPKAEPTRPSPQQPAQNQEAKQSPDPGQSDSKTDVGSRIDKSA